LTNMELSAIQKECKVIYVPSFDYYQINLKMFGDEYLETTMNQKKVVDSMLFYYSRHREIDLFKRTDYICNEKEKICICNKGAEDLRKLYLDAPKEKTISWFSFTSSKEKNMFF